MKYLQYISRDIYVPRSTLPFMIILILIATHIFLNQRLTINCEPCHAMCNTIPTPIQQHRPDDV